MIFMWGGGGGVVDSPKQGGDVVCLDDAAGTPDLADHAEVDGPFVFLVCGVDDGEPLNI